MEALGQYVIVLVMLICLAVGYIIKHSLNFIPNKYIPLILGALGVVINIWISKGTFTPEILLGGLASGLASTGAFEITKNMMPKDKNSAELLALIKKTIGTDTPMKETIATSDSVEKKIMPLAENSEKESHHKKVKEHKKATEEAYEKKETESECKDKKDKKH